MNQLLLALDAPHLKPALTALLLPPVPWLALVLLGALLLGWTHRRGWGALLVSMAVCGLWLGNTVAVAQWLQRALLPAAAALSPKDLARMRREVSAGTPVAVLVLGGGRDALAPEYGAPGLPPLAFERLRYGVWLARATGASLAFAGGVGHAQADDGPSEADVAARLVQAEYGVALRWRDSASRDTRENAARAVVLLRDAGVREVLLVTHGWHLPRARRAFEDAAARVAPSLRVTPAPMGLAAASQRPLLRWLPSDEGQTLSRRVWREWLGLQLGA